MTCKTRDAGWGRSHQLPQASTTLRVKPINFLQEAMRLPSGAVPSQPLLALRQGAAFSRMKASPLLVPRITGAYILSDDVFLCTSSHSLCEEQPAKGLRNEGLLRVLTVFALFSRVPQITACSLPRYSAEVGGEAGVGGPGCPTPRRHARAKP